MFTYQLRRRLFRREPGEEFSFPATCELCFHFQPSQPFGTEPGGGRTAIDGPGGVVTFDANAGHHTIESELTLEPLDVTIDAPDSNLRLSGTTLTLSARFETFGAMESAIDSIFYALPILLNASFSDPPYIERVEGKVGTVKFYWQLADWNAVCDFTTQQRQTERFSKAWERMELMARPDRRRLVAALHYFHVACRLARQGCTAGEFIAEVILNLSKSLEVLFPPDGDRKNRDAVRAGLRALGYSDKEIESDFLPAMALRNEIDVGHAELAMFTTDQLSTLHSYTDQAERVFRKMFDALLEAVQLDKVTIAPYEPSVPKQALRIVRRLRQQATREEIGYGNHSVRSQATPDSRL